MQSAANFTNCGLPGVGEVPHGIHMCHFYRGREDLVAALVPFFAAGLRSNERRAPLRRPDHPRLLGLVYQGRGTD
jgi:hypothetical protein